MQPSDDLIIQFENHFLKQLIHLLKNHSLTVEKAKESMERYLALYPFDSEEVMTEKISQFCTENTEFKPLEEALKKLEEQNKLNRLLSQMRSHLKDNNLAEVLKLAQQ